MIDFLLGRWERDRFASLLGALVPSVLILVFMSGMWLSAQVLTYMVIVRVGIGVWGVFWWVDRLSFFVLGLEVMFIVALCARRTWPGMHHTTD